MVSGGTYKQMYNILKPDFSWSAVPGTEHCSDKDPQEETQREQ